MNAAETSNRGRPVRLCPKIHLAGTVGSTASIPSGNEKRPTLTLRCYTAPTVNIPDTRRDFTETHLSHPQNPMAHFTRLEQCPPALESKTRLPGTALTCPPAITQPSPRKVNPPRRTGGCFLGRNCSFLLRRICDEPAKS